MPSSSAEEPSALLVYPSAAEHIHSSTHPWISCKRARKVWNRRKRPSTLEVYTHVASAALEAQSLSKIR